MTKIISTILPALLLAQMAAYSADQINTPVLDRQWVAIGANGKLEYKKTPKDNRS
jgi:hemolysin-activating ACP:hemolysin acyltransferase